jgi:hypothetical protein
VLLDHLLFHIGAFDEHCVADEIDACALSHLAAALNADFRRGVPVWTRLGSIPLKSSGFRRLPPEFVKVITAFV